MNGSLWYFLKLLMAHCSTEPTSTRGRLARLRQRYSERSRAIGSRTIMKIASNRSSRKSVSSIEACMCWGVQRRTWLTESGPIAPSR